MRKDLLRRVERLEQPMKQFCLPWLHIALTSDGPEPGPDERLVDDWLSAENGLVITIDRITMDPNDEGKRCTPKLDWGRQYFGPLEGVFPARTSRTIENIMG
jgi:hypothetical protein